MVEREGRSRVFLQRMNGQNEHKSTIAMGDASCALQAGFKQVVGGHAAVRIPPVGWVEHKPRHGAVPVPWKRVSESCCVASNHAGVGWRLTVVSPRKIGLCTLNHLGMNVDTNRWPATE